MKKISIFNKLYNIESKKKFILIVYLLFIVHQIYEYFIIKELFTIKIIVLKITFLISIFFLSKIYILNKHINTFSKYMVFTLFMFYQIAHDVLFINTFNQYIISPYLDFFVIIIAPLYLSKIFLLIISICELIRYYILIYFFQINYLGELMFTLILSIVTSFLILLTLKSLKKEIQSESEKRIKENMLLTMEILEMKDPYTKGHSQRVANYALSLAEVTKKYDKKELSTFYLACLLHDIGKIGISDEILNKTSQLTDEEYNIIKTHPNLGIKLLENLSLIEGYEGIIYFHHERWDGKGYPNKLKQDEIPLSARIVSIADAFDAMTSSRSYRSALTPEEAYRRIIEGAGSQFDPELIKYFKIAYPTWIKSMIR
ncbi:HD domain-containing phosphohydrolase [Bacillus cereus group sp. RP43]|uniref:HD-GYP domain-containing protein n=1 Tax=Bacillus cereus group sp. RP43 TaxID=3040260 RepID=UPI00339AC3D7